MQRLSTLDASFLEVEDAVSHMQIGSVSVFEGPAPAYEALRGMVLGKLHLVPRYRQVVRRVPLGAGRPVWVDDPHFNLEYHLRLTALPAPGGESELRRLVGRVMSHQLDRSKPLWEMWAVEGLEQGRWALVCKTHHCMVDGVSAADLLSVMLDRRRESPAPGRDTWEPTPAPGSGKLLSAALAESVTTSLHSVGGLLVSGRVAAQGRDVLHGLLRMSGVIRPTPSSSLNGPVGPNRTWSIARAQLSDIRAVQAARGGTVNDVVLAAISGGFRRLLLSRGESTERVVRTLVPVSVRSEDEHGELDNRVSAIFAELPVGVEDPAERLDSIRRQMTDLKRSKEAVAGEALLALGDFAPPMLLALAERWATRVPQHSINTVTTNVPGPQYPLYAEGRRMLEAFPYVPLGGHVRVGVAIFSYDGALTFGVTGDYDTTSDAGILCEGIEESIAALLSS